MQCKVCESGAVEIGPKDFDGLNISCVSCGPYAISGTLSDSGIWDGMSQEECARAFAHAKLIAKPGERPLIDSYTR